MDLSAFSRTFSAEPLVSVFKCKVLRDWGKNVISQQLVFIEQINCPLKQMLEQCWGNTIPLREEWPMNFTVPWNSILKCSITYMLCTWPCTQVAHSAHWVYLVTEKGNWKIHVMNALWSKPVLQENLNELVLKYDLYLKFKLLKGCICLLETQGWENFLRSIAILPKHSAGPVLVFLVLLHHPYSCEAGEQEAPTLCCLSVRLHHADLHGYSSPWRSPHKNASSRKQKERLMVENKNKYQSKEGLNLVHLQIKLLYNSEKPQPCTHA